MQVLTARLFHRDSLLLCWNVNSLVKLVLYKIVSGQPIYQSVILTLFDR